MPSEILLLALLLLLLKHFIADFLLQTGYMWRNKGRYGHRGGLLHAGLHGAGSVPALLVLGADPMVLVAVVVAEVALHYHIDWAKEQVSCRLRLNPDRALFWNIMGLDQFLHHLTYLAMVAIFALGS